MQILEIWSNLFTKCLKLYSIFFYHICFLYFVNFEKTKFDAHVYKFDKV
jgi:hypothetical protein